MAYGSALDALNKMRGSYLPREYLIQDNGVLTALRSFSDSAIISFA